MHDAGRLERAACIGKPAQHQSLDKGLNGFGFECRDTFGVCERLLQSVLYDMPSHLVDGLNTDEVGDDPLGTGRDLGRKVGIPAAVMAAGAAAMTPTSATMARGAGQVKVCFMPLYVIEAPYAE